MKTFGRIATAIIVLACLVGTILLLVYGPRLAAIATGALTILFGVMSVMDLRNYLRERQKS